MPAIDALLTELCAKSQAMLRTATYSEPISYSTLKQWFRN